jgi:hypothetical protein
VRGKAEMKTVWLVKFKGKTFQHTIHANTWDERMTEIDKILNEIKLTRDDILNITYVAY